MRFYDTEFKDSCKNVKKKKRTAGDESLMMTNVLPCLSNHHP